MVLTAPLIDGVDDEGDEPRVCVVRVPLWAGAPVNPNQTAVPASQDRLRVTIVGWKACRPLGSMSCDWIPLQATHSSTEGVAICRLSAVRGF